MFQSSRFLTFAVVAAAAVFTATTTASYSNDVESGAFAFCPKQMAISKTCNGGESGTCGDGDFTTGIQCDCLPAEDGCDAESTDLREADDDSAYITWHSVEEGKVGWCHYDEVMVALCLSKPGNTDCENPTTSESEYSVIGCSYAASSVRGTLAYTDSKTSVQFFHDSGRIISSCPVKNDDDQISFVNQITTSTNVLECGYYYEASSTVVEASAGSFSLCPKNYVAKGPRYGGVDPLPYIGESLESNTQLLCECAPGADCSTKLELRDTSDDDITWVGIGVDTEEFAHCEENQLMVGLCITERSPGKYCELPSEDGKFFQTIIGCAAIDETVQESIDDVDSKIFYQGTFSYCSSSSYLWGVKSDYTAGSGEYICQKLNE